LSARITDIEEGLPHRVSEVICVKCGHRYICVRPEETLLKKMECGGCGLIGYMIETGQILKEVER
jgi:hypothetical protein